MKKRRFIHHLLAERDQFELLLNRLGFSHLTTMAGVTGQWSVKDIIAHIMSYEQFAADRIAGVINGETYSPASTPAKLEKFIDRYGYPDFGSSLQKDEVSNAWIVEKYRNTPLEDIVAHEIQAFGSIISGLEVLTENQIIQYNLFQLVAENTYEHYQEHIQDIYRWLASIT